MLKWSRRSTLPRGGTPPPPTAAITLSDGPVELPISPPSPTPPPIQNTFEDNTLQPLDQYAYHDYNDINGGNTNPELVSIEFAEHAPAEPDGWRDRARRLCKKKSVWALIVLLLVLVICLVAGLGVLWQKGDKGKTGQSSLTKSTTQPPAPSSAKPDLTPTNPVILTNPSEGSTSATTPTKRITTVTSTIRTPLAPSPYPTFPLWIGTFDSISPLISSSGTCKTSTSTTILQACADNARFTTTIADSKPDGYTIGTTPWVFQNHLVPAERSGKQWYYSGNSVEKKYSHASSPGCEVVEKAGIWLGKDGTYVLAVGYESTGACTLDSGKAKNPTAQVCGCMYEGVFATIS